MSFVRIHSRGELALPEKLWDRIVNEGEENPLGIFPARRVVVVLDAGGRISLMARRSVATASFSACRSFRGATVNVDLPDAKPLAVVRLPFAHSVSRMDSSI